MVKRKEYNDYLKNYNLNIKVCFMGHNSDLYRINKISKVHNNFKIDTIGGSMHYLSMHKIDVTGDYDLIVLDSSNIFRDYELNMMKNQAINISNTLSKRVTVVYHSYIDKSNEHTGLLQQILLYSVNNGEEVEEVIDLTYEEQLLFNALDLFVIALDKHREYNNQKQFKK